MIIHPTHRIWQWRTSDDDDQMRAVVKTCQMRPWPDEKEMFLSEIYCSLNELSPWFMRHECELRNLVRNRFLINCHQRDSVWETWNKWKDFFSFNEMIYFHTVLENERKTISKIDKKMKRYSRRSKVLRFAMKNHTQKEARKKLKRNCDSLKGSFKSKNLTETFHFQVHSIQLLPLQSIIFSSFWNLKP